MAAAEEKVYTVIIGEPWTCMPLAPKHIPITAKLRQSILDGPTATVVGGPYSTVYMFGCEAVSKQVLQKHWMPDGGHGNDAAGTSLIDTTGLDPDRHPFEWTEELQNSLSDAGYHYDAAIKPCRKMQPRILWMGETPGGDFGAEIWIRKAEKGRPATAPLVNASYLENTTLLYL